MGLFDFIGPASGLLFTLENIIWINLGVFIGCVFAAIPGLSVILCIILFLPVTYTMRAIPGMMFLLGIYCAGGYGGSVSAILINTPGTPHAAATMLDGYPLSKMGRTKAALKIALCITKISTFLILCDLAVCLATLYVSFSLVFALMRYLQGKVFLIRFYSPTTLSSSRAEFRLPSRLACA